MFLNINIDDNNPLKLNKLRDNYQNTNSSIAGSGSMISSDLILM